jgi:hypothetical protein
MFSAFDRYGSAPFVARLTCARENAPHSDEHAAKAEAVSFGDRFDPFTRLDAKLLPRARQKGAISESASARSAAPICMGCWGESLPLAPR